MTNQKLIDKTPTLSVLVEKHKEEKIISVLIEHDKPKNKSSKQEQLGTLDHDAYELIFGIDTETSESIYAYYSIKSELHSNPNPSLKEKYQYILNSLRALVTKNPNKLHRDNIDALIKFFSDTNWVQTLKDDKELQFTLSLDLIKKIEILVTRLENALPQNPSNDTEYEIDGIFLADKIFCDVLSEIGKEGKQDAKKCASKFKATFKDAEYGNTNLLSSWFNLNHETQEKPFHVSQKLIILSKAIIKDNIQKSLCVHPAAPKVRHSDSYVENRLMRKPLARKDLNVLPPDIQDIANKDFSVVGIGIKLSSFQEKIMNTLYNLLYENSEHNNQDSESFYAGNYDLAPVNYNIAQPKVLGARLITNQAQFMKAMTGKKNPSGKEITDGITGLCSIAKSKSLMKYTNDKTKDLVLVHEGLFKWYIYIKGKPDKEFKISDDNPRGLRNEKAIWLFDFHPILTHNIRERYVNFPYNIEELTAKAAGSRRRVTPAIIALRTFALQQIGFGQKRAIRNEDELDLMLGLDTAKKQGRKKRVIIDRDNTIRVVIKMGLILTHKTQFGVHGQNQDVFEFNLDYYKQK